MGPQPRPEHREKLGPQLVVNRPWDIVFRPRPRVILKGLWLSWCTASALSGRWPGLKRPITVRPPTRYPASGLTGNEGPWNSRRSSLQGPPGRKRAYTNIRAPLPTARGDSVRTPLNHWRWIPQNVMLRYCLFLLTYLCIFRACLARLFAKVCSVQNKIFGWSVFWWGRTLNAHFTYKFARRRVSWVRDLAVFAISPAAIFKYFRYYYYPREFIAKIKY